MTAAVRGNRRLRRAVALPTLALAVAALSACGADVDLGPKPTLSGADTTVSTVNGFYGQMLADGTGRTLYLFDGDRDGKSTCYGECAQTWQPFIADGEPTPKDRNVNALEDGKLDLVARQDGQQQVRYMDKPLYFYVGDKASADVQGVGKREFGGNWFAVTTLGNPVRP